MSSDKGRQQFYNCINGELVPAQSGQWIDSIDPATDQIWAQIPDSGPEDVNRAVEAAQSAFEGPWSQMAAFQRGALLRKMAEVVAEYKGELAKIETYDNGRILNETLIGDLPAVSEMFNYWAGAADKLQGETVNLSPQSLNYINLEPLGVVGIITPWNAPLAIFTAKAAAALAAGNTIVVKPAEQACCSILHMAKLFEEAGFPPGVVNVVSGLGATAGDAVTGHPLVRKVSFTGSTATARAITRRSADTIKPLSFELGGKSANIIFEDADLDAAVDGVSTSSIFTGGAGQTCVAGSRIMVHSSLYEEVVERICQQVKMVTLGDPHDLATTMGPIASREQFEKVKSYLSLAIEEGGKFVFGGKTGADVFDGNSPWKNGYYVEPTLIAGLDNSARTCREEIFGPVACIMPFDSDEQVLAMANDSEYGLGAGVWTNNLKRAHRIAAKLQTGVVWINAYKKVHWALPFGGRKDSGYGRDSGLESLKGYMQSKAVWVDLS